MDMALWAPALLVGGFALAALAVRVTRSRRRPRERGIAGTIAVVAIAIPRGGVGRIAHASRGQFARYPAREASGGAVAAGTPVVVLDLDRGIASVEALPSEMKEMFK